MAEPQQLLERLAANTPGGYQPAGPAMAEPTAWATLALANADRESDARRGADWLAEMQSKDGSVGVSAEQPTPAWPTSLAILSWLSVSPGDYATPLQNAIDWALEAKGRTTERKKQIGHDTTLIGWSWAADTHSWLEPTAMFVKALRAAGHRDHPRVREGVRLLVDRLLPSGGANYGNTLVLGQELLPHVQPTGLVLWALAGEPCDDPRIERSLAYLNQQLNSHTTTSSLAFGLLGLAAHGRRPQQANNWVNAAAAKALASEMSTYKLALLALASDSPQRVLAAAGAEEPSA